MDAKGASPGPAWPQAPHKAILSAAGFRQLMSCWICCPAQGLSRASFVRFRHQSRKGQSLGKQYADSPRQTAEPKAALMSSQGHLGTASVVFSTQPCRDQNRDRHPRRKESLLEMSGLGVLQWQEGASSSHWVWAISCSSQQPVPPQTPSLCSLSASLLCFLDVFKGGKKVEHSCRL